MNIRHITVKVTVKRASVTGSSDALSILNVRIIRRTRNTRTTLRIFIAANVGMLPANKTHEIITGRHASRSITAKKPKG